jgi:hypothetical protein
MRTVRTKFDCGTPMISNSLMIRSDQVAAG